MLLGVGATDGVAVPLSSVLSECAVPSLAIAVSAATDVNALVHDIDVVASHYEFESVSDDVLSNVRERMAVDAAIINALADAMRLWVSGTHHSMVHVNYEHLQHSLVRGPLRHLVTSDSLSPVLRLARLTGRVDAAGRAYALEPGDRVVLPVGLAHDSRSTGDRQVLVLELVQV